MRRVSEPRSVSHGRKRPAALGAGCQQLSYGTRRRVEVTCVAALILRSIIAENFTPIRQSHLEKLAAPAEPALKMRARCLRIFCEQRRRGIARGIEQIHIRR